MNGTLVSAWAGGCAAALFAGIAALHGYWAVGGIWPGRDREHLARTVVGGQPGSKMPGPAACWAVAAVLVLAAATVLGAAGLLPLPAPRNLVRGAAFLGSAVLLFRGSEGFVDRWLRPETVGSPFVRLNLWIYSPLCLALAALTWAAAR